MTWAASARKRVQVLPRRHTDARTYNMVVTVCVKAADLQQVLGCLMMASYLVASVLSGLRSARKGLERNACLLTWKVTRPCVKLLE